MVETHTIQWEGHTILAVLDHDSAQDIVRAQGMDPPEIPAGSNTVSQGFWDAEGRAVLYCAQRGFSPQASDNEHQVNGALCLILQTLPAPRRAHMILERFRATMASL
jgi:hypothetical protein